MLMMMAPYCEASSVTAEQKSALHLAAEYGNISVVRWLLKQGVNIYQEDVSGRTALHYAQNEGHKEIVAILRKHMPLDQLQVETHTRTSFVFLFYFFASGFISRMKNKYVFLV